MNEHTEEHGSCGDQERSPPASSSPLSSPSSIQTWLPAESPLRPPRMDQDHYVEMQSSPPSPFYEELFCTGRASDALVPLSGALVASSLLPQSDVVKQGYLGKLERSHRRYFVLRAGSHTGPSRLEWYKSREKFTATEKSAGRAALFGSSKQGVIYLRCCLGVSRSGSSRKGHTVALYAKDQTLVLAAEDQWEQEEWYLAVKRVMEEEHGEGFDEEDDGYCTLPPAAFFKEVWPVTVKPRGLGCSKSLAGESRLCLTATSLILVRVSACSDLPSVTIPLLSVRRFGHLDGSFFLELGRSAPNGPGEIWMEARDQGNSAAAQHIHEMVRETVRALRALPDFNRSPTSASQLQSLLSSKRCRPKYRDKQVHVRPLGSRLAMPPRNPQIQANPEAHKPHKVEPESPPETGGYMEMKLDRHLSVESENSQDPGEEQELGLGYMKMSPQVSPSSDDYMTMASPRKHEYSSPSSSLQTSFNSSISDSSSPLRSSRSRPLWLLTSVPSQMSIVRSLEEQTSARQRGLPPQTISSPVRRVDGTTTATPFITRLPGCTRPVPASQHQSVRRYRLSLCLPSCLQAEDRF